ncbi:lysoplasmalogenase [Mesorhizobium sp. YIM 152430]|uniref:lysoplasmalogenase n=1 Tax=Mesorhizobium sp. YIM 152430 TaxID=3031761 RepID=UPI0023DA30E8|nr:lysoplasmalogenase [Mesorhizobium sp. YIM 152430]MDF1598184.1 lysoplasmalogenase [Mesorhizobium sp. YIM 152430]
MLPFPGGLESQANGALILAILAAVIYLYARTLPVSWRRSAVKTIPLAALAWLSFGEGGPWLLTAALALSALGDLALAQEDDDRFFLAGLGAFLAAHVAYVALFATGSAGFAIFVVEPWRLAAALAICAFGIVMLLRLWPALVAAMRPAVLAYMLAIVAMGVAAFTTQSSAVMVGAVLFIASDAILATERFLLRPNALLRTVTGPAIWVTYIAAQIAITLGVLA